MELLLKAAEHPVVGMGDFAAGFVSSKKWRLPRQGSETVWRQNFSLVAELADQVLEVMIDQANWWQVLRLSEEETRRRFPDLTVASLDGCAKRNLEV